MTVQRPPQAEGYETRDARLRPILASAALLAVVVALAGFSNRWFEGFLDRSAAADDTPHPLDGLRDAPAAPVLLANPGDLLARYREKSGAQLETYGWVDAESGIVRMPIDAAMDLLVERGLAPHRDAAAEEQR